MFTVLVLLFLSHSIAGQLHTEHYTHRTHQAASEKDNNLSCYHCITLDDGEKCAQLQEYSSNTTVMPENLVRKCPSDMRMCVVKQFSYTLSTENSTSEPRLWSLERNCSSRCDPGCIVIGERIKLYACTTCCETSRCNAGKGGVAYIIPSNLLMFFISVIFIMPS